MSVNHIPPQAEASPVDSPGATLAAARVRRGLSLAQVADRSRVPRSALEALDADNWAALPGMTYARGFMRLYAREVGLDPEQIIGLLDARLDERDTAVERAHHAAEVAFRGETIDRVRTRLAFATVAIALLAVALMAVFGFAPQQLAAHPADAGPTETLVETP